MRVSSKNAGTKYCPVDFNKESEVRVCIGDYCMWWIETNAPTGACAIAKIAYELMTLNIRESYKEGILGR